MLQQRKLLQGRKAAGKALRDEKRKLGKATTWPETKKVNKQTKQEKTVEKKENSGLISCSYSSAEKKKSHLLFGSQRISSNLEFEVFLAQRKKKKEKEKNDKKKKYER